jgi:DNA-directed RNA polymerase subunit RPC12/RpoP
VVSRSSAAPILIDYSTVPEANWCWRPEWYCGSDSVYGLLAKFGSLNVLSTRELCELFVERNSSESKNRLPGRPHFPVVDLRYTKDFRVARLANLLRLDTARVRLGFVESLFPNATQIASTDLVWCPYCAKHGFHSPAFQLNYSSVCPLHGHMLLRRCTRCSSPLPYRLNATIRGELFSCPSCGKDFALAIRSPARTLEMKADAALLFADYSELIRFSDQLPTMIDACKALVGRPYMPLFISKPDIYRRSALFRQFVTDVLVSVSSHNCKGTQASLNLLAPSFTFAEPMHSPYATHAKSSVPSVRRAIKSVASETDQKLQEAWAIYRTVRRHLWRHHVCQHRSCAQLAMKTLWWDLEGEKTKSFCEIALAFIRWRMQWEGRRIPATLAISNRGIVPYGLLGWISKDSPISSVHWSPAFESWLNAHLLAAACLDSFAGWMMLSATHKGDHQVRWCMKDHEMFTKRHWACSGRGTPFEPGLLFLEPLTSSNFLSANLLSCKCTRMHHRVTVLALARVKR